MFSLLDKFFSLLPEALSTKYYTAKLQTRLHNHYGDTIVIETQKGQGQSNIVFSSSISVADAIRAASKLKADLKFSEVEASFVDVSDMQEDQILHDAAKVLRGSLHAVEISKDFYPSPSDLSHHLKSTCDVNLLSKLSIIFREWRVIVLFVLLRSHKGQTI
jgi:hypothetical protein